MKNNYAVVAVVVLGVLFATFPERLGGQAGDISPLSPNARAVFAMLKALHNEDGDLNKMEPSLNGSELTAAFEFDSIGEQGELELDATTVFLATYDRMECDPDRQVTKDILNNRLRFYSGMLGLQTDQVTGYLPSAKLPATAEAGTRIRDDLRAAKAKLDEIAASLN